MIIILTIKIAVIITEIRLITSAQTFRWCSRCDRPKPRLPLRLAAPASAAPAPGAPATPSRTRRATGTWWRRAASCGVPPCHALRVSRTQVAPPPASAPWADRLATARRDAPRTPRSRLWRWRRCRCTGPSKIQPSDGRPGTFMMAEWPMPAGRRGVLLPKARRTHSGDLLFRGLLVNGGSGSVSRLLGRPPSSRLVLQAFYFVTWFFFNDSKNMTPFRWISETSERAGLFQVGTTDRRETFGLREEDEAPLCLQATRTSCSRWSWSTAGFGSEEAPANPFCIRRFTFLYF